jgi:hypothetical protein
MILEAARSVSEVQIQSMESTRERPRSSPRQPEQSEPPSTSRRPTCEKGELGEDHAFPPFRLSLSGITEEVEESDLRRHSSQ